MHYVFRLGPLHFQDRESAHAFVAVPANGSAISAMHIARSDRDGLEALKKQLRGEPLAVEPELEKAAAKYGISSIPPTQELLEMKGAMAVVLAHAMSLSPDLFSAISDIVEAALELEDAAPWEHLDSDDALLVHVETPYRKTFEASLMGSAGEEFGLVLYPTQGTVARIRSGAVNARNYRELSFIALHLESEPEFARNAIEAAFGLGVVPIILKHEHGEAGPATHDDVALLAVSARAIAKLGPRDRRAEAAFESIDGKKYRVTVEMPKTPAFVPEVIQGAKGRVGRNEPCPCRSGKKYKKCCLAKEEAKARARTPQDRARLFHALDKELLANLLRFAENRWPGITANALERLFSSGTPRDLEEHAALSTFAYQLSSPNGERIVDSFLEARGPTLDRDAKTWLEANGRSHLSLWEVIDAVPGTGIEFRNLLTNEEAFVHEVSASETVHRWDVLLGRVVSIDDIHVMVGAHPRILGPREAFDVCERFRKKTKVGVKAVPGERLRDPTTIAYLWALWRESVDRVNAKESPSELLTMDGEAVLPTEDRFVFTSAARPRIAARLQTIDGARIDDDDAGRLEISIARRGTSSHSEWTRTVIGRVTLGDTELVLHTLSIQRADLLRKEIEAAVGDLARFRARVHTTVPIPEIATEGPLLVDEQRISSANPLRSVRDTYRRWLDDPHPALGISPRSAVLKAKSRRTVVVLLKQLEHRAPPPMEDTVEWLRSELGLDFDGGLLRKTRIEKMTARSSKMSDTLVDFADPILDETEAYEDAHRFQNVLRCAASVWNAVVAFEIGHVAAQPPSSSKLKDASALLSTALDSESTERCQDWIDALVKRKNDLFAGDLRIIGEVKVVSDPLQGFGVQALFAPASVALVSSTPHL